MHSTIASPVDYGGIQLKNRIIFAPTSLGLRGEAYREKLRRIAGGGCAMIVIGDVPVGKSGFGPSLFSREGFAAYRSITELIHREGCLVCAQLHQSDANFRAMLKYVPGVLTKKIGREQLRQLLNREIGPYISGLSAGKVAEITASFGPAAVQARAAGFDMVQVHGDRMCGSFSSTVFNRRTDAYGGGAENRARFAVEAVSAVRRALPEMPIDFKLPVRQEHPRYGSAGVLPEELAVFVPMLEAAGVTSFHVTLADHASLTDTIPPAAHPCFGGEGCFLPFCDLVRRYTKLPVCGVGGLTDPDFVEAQLAAGRIDCAAMSRQLIADPDWPDKVMRGRPEQVRRCIRCNRGCLGGITAHQGVHCIYDGRPQPPIDTGKARKKQG